MSSGFPTEPTTARTEDPMDDRVRKTLQAHYQATQARVANGMVSPRQNELKNLETRPQSGWFLLAAAAVVLAVAAVGLLLVRGDDQVSLDAAGDDDPTVGVQTEDEPALEPVEGYLRGNGYAVLQLEGDGRTSFAAVDINEGDVVETFWSEQLEATGFDSMELAPDGLSVYLVQSFEDSWFSCESSLPSIVQLDLTPGLDQAERMTEVARGTEPRLSLSGTKLAYLTASTCVPDPEQPEMWVVSVLDTIVIRNLATGVELRYTLPGPVDAVNAGGDYRELDLRGLVWMGDARLGVSDEEILRIDGQTITVTDEQMPNLIEPGSPDRISGYLLDGREVLIEVRDPNDPKTVTGLDSVMLDSGSRREMWRSGSEVPNLGDLGELGIVTDVDTLGRRFYLGPATAPITSLELPDGSTFEGPLRITGYGW